MQKIRKFSLCLFFVVLLGLSPQLQAQTKKGCAGQTANAYKVGAVWAYDWGANAKAFPGNVEHVPMWWSYYGASQQADNTAAANLKAAGAKSLLAYNEPDHTDQANLSVEYALQGFKQAGIACSAAGLELISVACADDNSTWMQQFMAAVASQKLKCDAVAVHSYLRDPNAFLRYIDGIHDRYGKNIWITEFAPTDWASPTAVTTADVKNFINIVIPALESRSYVIRYSWYCGTLPGPNVLGTAALFDASGNLTEAGIAYRDAGGSSFTPVPTNTPKPTAPPTPLSPGTQSLEAEEAYWNSGAIESDHTGYSGSGYVNTANETGAYIEWTVNVSSAGSAECSFRYGNGAENRPLQLSVNGSTVVASLNFPNTGAWTTWLDVRVGVSLSQGNNTIRITSLVTEGAANIDRMDITTGISGGICGDVNKSGSVDIIDALMTAQYYVGLNPSGFYAGNGDVNGDGSINIVDALMIAQAYVGLLSSLDC